MQVAAELVLQGALSAMNQPTDRLNEYHMAFLKQLVVILLDKNFPAFTNTKA